MSVDRAPSSEIALSLEGPRALSFRRVEVAAPMPGEVKVRTLYSGISAGTELAAYRGSSPYLRKRWDPNSRLFVQAASPSLTYPADREGYEQVGEIIEVGRPEDIELVGTTVFGIWGHCTAGLVKVEEVSWRTVPAGVDPRWTVLVQNGATALNGVLDGAIRLGETVAVFGLGVVGQLVAQYARLSGARVIGVDLLPFRLRIARDLGADEVLDAGAGSAAEAIKQLTDGRGADVCIEVTGASAALHEAIRACAYSAKVVAMGFQQGPAQQLFLGEEFHHNRINVVCSQIFGQSPELTYRWSTRRLIATFLSLVADGRVRIEPLITHVVPFGEAPAAFRMLDEASGDALQTILDLRDGLAAPGQILAAEAATGTNA